ncbi:MAG TPA: hypothetical protein VEG39_19155, partial [Clostridia bacterium]|nr:hypothetical protein [Clostridia bacterium]
MQFINEQYKIVKAKSVDSYGTTYVVKDIQNGDQFKHLRIINLQKETRDFIEYMKNNFYDYSTYFHPNLMDFCYFNRIKFINYKQVAVNQYYYTYNYFESVNAFKYCKGKDTDVILNLTAELCSAVKYLHLRGFLLHSIDMNAVQIINDDSGDHLKIVSIPYPEKSGCKIVINKENLCFKAPEIHNGVGHSVLSDIYIIGAAVFYMLSGFNNYEEKLENSMSSFSTDEVSDQYKPVMDIIRKCTAVEPQNRFQSVEDIVSSINDYFNKNYNIIEKQYIQTMPHYRMKPVGRYNLIDRILNNAKGHFFVGRPNKASLMVCQEGSGKDNFLDVLSIKAEHEGFIPVQIALNESELSRFSASEILIRSIIKYVDKELIDKYIGDMSNVTSQISRHRATSLNKETAASWEDNRAKLIQRFSSFTIEASKKSHFIFVIDNFQLIDKDSLVLIDEIIKSQNSSKTYFVFAINKELHSKNLRIKECCKELKEMGFLDTIALKNLDIEDASEFIRLILGMNRTPYEFAKRIYNKTNGSPEYIYDTVYMLFSNNSIFIDDKGNWVLDKVDYEALNFSYADDIGALNIICKLDSIYQDILKAVSVFNIAVSADILENYVDIKGEKLVSQLNYLSYINILVRKQNDWGVSYCFSSSDLKKAMYESIHVEVRQKYHEKASYALKSKFKRENRENEDELLHQMLCANWHIEVKEYLLDSVKEMIENNSLEQAIQFLGHAYNLFSKENVTEERILVCNKLGELYERIGEYSKAVFYYDIIENEVKNSDDSYQIVDVYIKKYALLYKMSDRTNSLKYLAWAKRLIKAANYRKGMYEHIVVINRMMLHKRKYGIYLKILENALKSIDKNEYEFLYARMLGIYGRFMAFRGRYEEGLNALTESLQILEGMGNYRKMLYPLNSMGRIYYINYNDIQKAREYHEKCLSISQKVNEIYYIGISYNNLAEQYRREDRYSEALVYYYNSLENITRIKDKFTEFTIYLNITSTNIAIEDFNKAALTLNGMEDEFKKSKHSVNLMDQFNQCRAEFFYTMGEYEKASEYAQKAVEMCISWGITENYEAHFVKLLSEIKLK